MALRALLLLRHMGVYIPPFPRAPPLPNLALPCPPRPTDGGPYHPTSPPSPAGHARRRPAPPPHPHGSGLQNRPYPVSGSRSCLAPGWRRSARAGGLDLAVGASAGGVTSEPANFSVLGFA